MSLPPLLYSVTIRMSIITMYMYINEGQSSKAITSERCSFFTMLMLIENKELNLKRKEQNCFPTKNEEPTPAEM